MKMLPHTGVKERWEVMIFKVSGYSVVERNPIVPIDMS